MDSVMTDNLPNVELLQQALARVSATLKDAFGIVNIEALAAVTPVIAYRVGGIPKH